MENITIIGMDPPVSKNCGWAVIKLVDDKITLLEKFTQILDDAREVYYLEDVYQKLEELIKKHGATVLCLEMSMGGGFAFGRARLNEFVGVCKLCCLRNNLKVIEVVPSHLKMTITGHGKAPKKKIMENIVATFGLSEPGPEHECDAAGFALNYLIDSGWQGYVINHPYTKAMLKKEKKKKEKRRKLKERRRIEKMLKGESTESVV